MNGAPPLLKAAGLWEHVSSKGNRYFVGRLGGVKVLILENRDRQADNEPSHHLFFAEPAERTPQSTKAPVERAPRRRRPYKPAPRPAEGDGDPRPFNDPIPF